MPTRLLSIASITGWNNPGRAAPGDGDLYADSQSGNGFITFAFANPLIPPDEEVVGIGVTLRAALDLPPNGVFFLPGVVASLEAQVSKNGTDWSVRQRTAAMNLHATEWTEYGLGGMSDEWGLEFVASDFNSTGFRLRVRRPTDGNEDTSQQRLLESATVIVYTTIPGSSYMSREQVHERSLIGKETTPGTPVSATILLQGAALKIDPRFEAKEHLAQGQKNMLKSSLVAEWVEGDISGDPCFNELGFFLSSVIAKPVTQLLTSGVYRHQFNLSNMSKDDIRTFTVECGQPSICTKAAMVIVNALQLECARKTISLSGNVFGQKADLAATMSTQASEVQTLTITGSPTAIRLRHKGAEVDVTISGGASAFQTALTGLSTIGSGNLAASGTGPYTFTFQGALAGTDQPAIEVVSITGGSGPTAVVVRTTKGGPTKNKFQPILPGGSSVATVHIASSLDGLDAGKLSDAFKSTLGIGNRFTPKWVFSDTLASFKDHAEAMPEIVHKVVLEANATGVGELAKWRAGTSQFLEFRWVGPVIAGGYAYTLKCTQSVEVVGFEPLDETDGVVTVEVSYKPRFDESWGQAMQWVLINEIASY